jgi:hypothetical protein
MSRDIECKLAGGIRGGGRCDRENGDERECPERCADGES